MFVRYEFVPKHRKVKESRENTWT